MPTSSARNDHLLDYTAYVDREEELERLRNQVKARKALLVFGPSGVGKSRLLQAFVAQQPLALYVPQLRSPSELLHTLLEALNLADKRIKIPANVNALSSRSLKGVVHRALDTKPFVMVLDHLEGPSRVVTAVIKDLHYFGRTPLIFASRSPHMEDIGTLQPLCALKSERVEVKNWPHNIALEFAQQEAERTNLEATNIGSFLPSIVQWCDGNPGAILDMIRMAHMPRYQVADQIKAHILYVDYRMGRRT